jgi:hypothetical protein
MTIICFVSGKRASKTGFEPDVDLEYQNIIETGHILYGSKTCVITIKTEEADVINRVLGYFKMPIITLDSTDTDIEAVTDVPVKDIRQAIENAIKPKVNYGIPN